MADINQNLQSDLFSLDLLAEHLKKINIIDFALIFGSYAVNRNNRLSDLDIAAYFNKDISLLEIGGIINDLESDFKRQVDFIVLNDLFKRKPAFTFEVISSGKPIFIRDNETFIDFLKKTFLYYIDIRPTLDMFNQKFLERLRSGNFGKSNYIG